MFSSFRCDAGSESPPGRLIRASEGTSPDRYLSVNTPCANGENPMQPTPSSRSASSSSSSIQRFSMLYEGWWMRSGTCSSRRSAAASRLRAAEYDEIPTYKAFPSWTALASAPIVSSRGVSGSNRCE